jgi:hypothetical protein
MIPRRGSVPKKLEQTVGMSIPRLPATVRRFVEAGVLVSLAGGLDALLAEGSGYIDDHDEVVALEALETLREAPKLTPREVEGLAAAERGDEPNAGDEANAFSAAMLLASSDDQAHAYLRWLRSVAADYVLHPDFRRDVELLVPELLRHEVISGRRARQIIKEGGGAG